MQGVGGGRGEGGDVGDASNVEVARAMKPSPGAARR